MRTARLFLSNHAALDTTGLQEPAMPDFVLPELVSRAEAHTQGLKHYFTGLPLLEWARRRALCQQWRMCRMRPQRSRRRGAASAEGTAPPGVAAKVITSAPEGLIVAPGGAVVTGPKAVSTLHDTTQLRLVGL
jgi:hypothetical protein